MRYRTICLAAGTLLLGCSGEGGGFARSAGALVGSTEPQVKEGVKDGTLVKETLDALAPSDKLVEAAHELGVMDERIWGQTRDPQKCPYGTFSWDWVWRCKDGKLKGGQR